jgi:hypothetical protein
MSCNVPRFNKKSLTSSHTLTDWFVSVLITKQNSKTKQSQGCDFELSTAANTFSNSALWLAI